MTFEEMLKQLSDIEDNFDKVVGDEFQRRWENGDHKDFEDELDRYDAIADEMFAATSRNISELVHEDRIEQAISDRADQMGVA
jgi:hypothetical protein